MFYGPDIRILPILCGPFARSIYQGGKPEDDDKREARFWRRWASCATREGDRLFWVLGIDMAHMGARYRTVSRRTAGEGAMTRSRRARRAAASTA